mmetsp:Transcript_38280/g.69001  ORF Transcript_38280/g.69001 Transcript_38280/m.69001 type:complete len:200 (+) Transcript_38280:2639-3238(+)
MLFLRMAIHYCITCFIVADVNILFFFGMILVDNCQRRRRTCLISTSLCHPILPLFQSSTTISTTITATTLLHNQRMNQLLPLRPNPPQRPPLRQRIKNRRAQLMHRQWPILLINPQHPTQQIGRGEEFLPQQQSVHALETVLAQDLHRFNRHVGLCPQWDGASEAYGELRETVGGILDGIHPRFEIGGQLAFEEIATAC